MADIEKQFLEKFAALPEAAQQRLLDKADGVIIAMDVLSKAQNEKGEKQDGP